MSDIVKICTIHGKLTKNQVYFRKKYNYTDCKQCVKNRSKEYAKNNPEKRKILNQKYVERHKERILLKSREKGRERRKNNSAHLKKINKIYRDNNPKKLRGYRLKRFFNLTLEDYDKMFKEQKGLCGICFMPETVLNKISHKPIPLAVDHCHKTKKNRGLLCRACNTSLGGYRDSIEIHESATKYLKKYQGSALV